MDKRVDEVSLIGFRLQRILSFLMIANVLGFLFGAGLLSLQGFIWQLIGFIGAYKRSPRLLGIYVFMTIAMFVFYLIIGLFSVSAPVPQSYSSSGSVDPLSSSHEATPATNHFAAWLRGASSEAAGISSSESQSSTEFSSTSAGESTSTALVIFVVILILFVVLFVAYCKIYSLILAYRMRKMILAQQSTSLPVVIEYLPNEDEHENAPLHTPINESVPEGVYPFMQPNFTQYPYPLNMQGAPSVLPPPLMYGQQPVFYTYGPMPYPQTPSNPEKQ